MVILVPLLTASIALGVSLLQRPLYEASTTVEGAREGASQQENISSRISGLQILAHEMAVMGLNRSMVEEVANTQGGPGALSASYLRNNLTVAQVEDTRFLLLTYQDADSDTAQAAANDAAKIFARKAPRRAKWQPMRR
jgi:capsular polysaccharide biosynthesis protein